MISKKEWYTIDELEQLSLVGLNKSKVTIHRKAKKENWIKRQCTGVKGVAFEYHISSLPYEAQKQLGFTNKNIKTNEISIIDNANNQTINTFSLRLKEAIGNESNNAFAIKCGLSEKTIRKYLKGEAYPTLDSLFVLSQASGKTIEWLATGVDSPNTLSKYDNNKYVAVPDLNIKVAAGSGTYPISEEVGEFIFSKYWLQKEGLSNANLAIFHVQGDSMESTIHDGDIALVNINESGWTGAINGIFILLVDDMLIIKRIEFDLIQKGIHVISDNPAYRPYFLKLNEENTTIKVLAKVERILTKPPQKL